jgi:hypothetical protein
MKVVILLLKHVNKNLTSKHKGWGENYPLNNANLFLKEEEFYSCCNVDHILLKLALLFPEFAIVWIQYNDKNSTRIVKFLHASL